MSFLSDWKNAKKAFEAATSRHKPGPKFLEIFHKPDVEDVAGSFDKALAKEDIKALENALIDRPGKIGGFL